MRNFIPALSLFAVLIAGTPMSPTRDEPRAPVVVAAKKLPAIDIADLPLYLEGYWSGLMATQGGAQPAMGFFY